MAWIFTDDIDAYRAAAGGLLGSQPERNTVLLSVLATLIRLGPAAFDDAAPLLGWWSDGGAVGAAVLQTPPHPMLVTDLPGESAGQLAAALAGRGASLPGVNGAEPDVAAFAQAWQQVTGRPGQVYQRQRLYRLGELIPPAPAPDGLARIAAAADEALVTSWFEAFGAEAGVGGAPDRLVSHRLRSGHLMLWEAAGEPRSLAGVTDVSAGVARVGPVYTPPGWRGRGYGGAVTVAISRLAMSRGAESVILFTDLANPASNALYARLGYQAVEDRVVLTFAD